MEIAVHCETVASLICGIVSTVSDPYDRWRQRVSSVNSPLRTLDRFGLSPHTRVFVSEICSVA